MAICQKDEGIEGQVLVDITIGYKAAIKVL